MGLTHQKNITQAPEHKVGCKWVSQQPFLLLLLQKQHGSSIASERIYCDADLAIWLPGFHLLTIIILRLIFQSNRLLCKSPSSLEHFSSCLWILSLFLIKKKKKNTHTRQRKVGHHQRLPFPKSHSTDINPSTATNAGVTVSRSHGLPKLSIFLSNYWCRFCSPESPFQLLTFLGPHLGLSHRHVSNQYMVGMGW